MGKGATKCTSRMKQAIPASSIEAKSPATVPSTLTAPSVPLGTILNVVTRYLFLSTKQLERAYLFDQHFQP